MYSDIAARYMFFQPDTSEFYGKCFILTKEYSRYFIVFGIGISYGPCVLITVANAVIIACLRKSLNQFQSSKKTQNAFQITIMLLTLTLSYTILALPATIIETTNKYRPDWFNSDSLQIGRAVADFLHLCNYALNYFIYILTSREMRQVFWGLIRPKVST